MQVGAVPGGDDLRVEVPRVDAVALVERHHAEVSAFCKARNPLMFLVVVFLGASSGHDPGAVSPPLAILKGVGVFALVRAVALPLGLIALGLDQLAERLFRRDS